LAAWRDTGIRTCQCTTHDREVVLVASVRDQLLVGVAREFALIAVAGAAVNNPSCCDAAHGEATSSEQADSLFDRRNWLPRCEDSKGGKFRLDVLKLLLGVNCFAQFEEKFPFRFNVSFCFHAAKPEAAEHYALSEPRQSGTSTSAATRVQSGSESNLEKRGNA